MSGFDGSGTFVISGTGLPYVTGTTISSTVANQLDTDLATGLSTCVTKDGQTPATANLPMGGYAHTGVAGATARTQYVDVAGYQDGKYTWVASGGTADAITAAYSPAIATLVDGQFCFFRATATNATTTPTFSPNSLTAHTITRDGGSALYAGDIETNAEYLVRYNLANTRWELFNPSTSSQVYIPNQTNFTGSFAVGDGLRNLTHSTAVEGFYNTTCGIGAGLAVTSGYGSTLLGTSCGKAITTGFDNTGLGYETLLHCVDGYNNTALGPKSLYTTVSGYRNTAVGSGAIFTLASGYQNVGVGVDALTLATTTTNTVGIGYSAFSALTTGYQNTGVGGQVGNTLTTGWDNTFVGWGTGDGVTTGNYNTVIGAQVTGLAADLSNNIILADGLGNIRIQVNGGVSTAISTPTWITGATAAALSVGPNGTTNPAFNVDASAVSSATGLNIISAAAAGGVGISILSSGSNEPLKIDAKGSGAITIGGTSTGNTVLKNVATLGVGTNSALVGGILSVLGGTDVTTGVFKNSSASSAEPLAVWNAATSGNSYFVTFSTEGTQTVRGSITYNRGGGLTAYNTTSDYRAKDILGPADGALDVVNRIKVYRGKMKGAEIERPMFIAHEVQEGGATWAVTGEKDAVKDDGTPLMQQVSEGSLVPMLWAAVQALSAQVEELKKAR